MSASVQVVCPTCHVEVAAASAFCTRCGSALPALTVVGADAGSGQQWGGNGRRERPGRAANRRAAAAQQTALGAPAVISAPVYPGAASGQVQLPLQAGPASAGAAVLDAAFDRVTPALTARRLGAYAIDALLVTVVGGSIGLLTQSFVSAGLGAGELVIGLVVWEARSGRTLGNSVLGLRAARAETPYAPGLGRALRRATVLLAGHLVVGVGQWLVVASSAFDRSGRRQGWHDQAGRVVVVDVRALHRADAAAATAAAAAAVAVPVVRAVAPVVAVPPEVPAAPDYADFAAPAAPAVPIRAIVPGPVDPRPTPSHRAVAAAAYVLTLDTGESITVAGPGLVGRRPSAPAGMTCDHLIAIEDEGRSLSRTHAQFGIDAAGFWVEDRASGNGTFVLSADGSSVQVLVGEQVTVPPGGAVRLGERTFTVEAVRTGV